MTNHTLTTNEQACLPPQAIWFSPPPEHHTEKACHSVQKRFHKQHLESLTTSPIDRAILLSLSAPQSRAHLMQPNSEAYEAQNRCFRVWFEPDVAVAVINESSTSKDTWGMVAVVVRGLLRRPSLSVTPTVTFCSVHIHNVAAKSGMLRPLLRTCCSTMLASSVVTSI